uniref:Olfactomedin-like domain-containing protein n=1 Tax=Kryptolebias marmoratus TaxID=37003 RepID=A0A3Q3BGB1_KRYMA
MLPSVGSASNCLSERYLYLLESPLPDGNNKDTFNVDDSKKHENGNEERGNSTNTQSTYGVWMSDASRPEDRRLWVAEHFSGGLVGSRCDLGSVTELTKFFQGCGHVIYKGSFYFHNGGSNQLVKWVFFFSLNVLKLIYNNLSYLFRNSKTYFKFAVDENGLWVIFASDANDNTVVAKLNPDTFTVESVINTAFPTAKAGNAFIVCGVLYVTDHRDWRVTFAFDLKTQSPLEASFGLRQSDGIMAMLSYYPHESLLYMWNNRSMSTCRVKFKHA